MGFILFWNFYELWGIELVSDLSCIGSKRQQNDQNKEDEVSEVRAKDEEDWAKVDAEAVDQEREDVNQD